MSRGSRIWKFLLAAVGLCLALFAFRFGYNLTVNGDGRDPAAISRNHDFTAIEGEALSLAMRSRLIEGLNVVSTGTSMGIELGSFLTKNSEGRTVSVCEVYSKVEMQFIAGDIAVSGEPPRLIIEGDCQRSDYLNRISPLMIPFGRILKSQVRDQVFPSDNDPNLKVTLENVSDSWPHTWVLDKIRLFETGGPEILMDRDQIKNIHGKYLALELPQ